MQNNDNTTHFVPNKTFIEKFYMVDNTHFKELKDTTLLRGLSNYKKIMNRI